MTHSSVAIGLDHRHIYGMTAEMQRVGVACLGYWTEGTPQPLAGFAKRFPDLSRFSSPEAAFHSGATLALIAAKPSDRADLAISAMEHGLDVMVDKPGCTSLDQLARIKTTVERTGRIWSVNFSERFETRCSTVASELVASGAIGQVIHTTGLGPHRLNRATRPDWFFQRANYGGILTDIASHQIDQFLHYTGSQTAEIAYASVDCRDEAGFQDIGEINLRSPSATGYIRVDWFTPDALPTWGDGRLTILGTEGYIELRKYCDAGTSDANDTVILVNGTRCERIDASGADLPYFSRLLSDLKNRTETAMTQAHCFTVMELALRAQMMAEAGS
jgi:predicted dehydrogenase